MNHNIMQNPWGCVEIVFRPKFIAPETLRDIDIFKNDHLRIDLPLEQMKELITALQVRLEKDHEPHVCFSIHLWGDAEDDSQQAIKDKIAEWEREAKEKGASE